MHICLPLLPPNPDPPCPLINPQNTKHHTGECILLRLFLSPTSPPSPPTPHSNKHMSSPLPPTQTHRGVHPPPPLPLGYRPDPHLPLRQQPLLRQVLPQPGSGGRGGPPVLQAERTSRLSSLVCFVVLVGVLEDGWRLVVLERVGKILLECHTHTHIRPINQCIDRPPPPTPKKQEIIFWRKDIG